MVRSLVPADGGGYSSGVGGKGGRAGTLAGGGTGGFGSIFGGGGGGYGSGAGGTVSGGGSSFVAASGTNVMRTDGTNGGGTSQNGLVSMLAPTAATVSIRGRVTTMSGRCIRNVRLTLANSSGHVRTATTSSFGYYRFNDVQAGEPYILSVAAKQYTFAEPVQLLDINEAVDAANFVAN